jgi:hypothetical protein
MSEEIKKVKEYFGLDKEKCACGKMAVYWYMPGYEGKKEEQNYFCDKCVPRGCSCEWNHVKEFGPPPDDHAWKWVVIPPGDKYYEEVKEGEMWVHIDEQGREYPCCEFMYDKNGFTIHKDLE